MIEDVGEVRTFIEVCRHAAALQLPERLQFIRCAALQQLLQQATEGARLNALQRRAKRTVWGEEGGRAEVAEQAVAVWVDQ